jgi:hypothetical protein
VNVLPEFNSEGDLPSGVNVVAWQDFHSRFGLATPRRVWLLGRLRRVFVWGSFVTTKPAPRDLDVLPIMDEDFEVERIAPPASEVFDSTRAKLRFESDVFRGRASIGEEVLQTRLETYQISRTFRKTGYRGLQQDYLRLAEPILLEIQQREQEIFEYLSSDLEQQIAS